jgi:16S rRNA (adenine1518-N6/adenine1519-N6)-dimethyltransferase
MTIVKPKKALGQHFLKDLEIAARIACTLDLYKGIPVLEIGPGTGVLTKFLLQNGHDLKVIELDRESVKYLKENFKDLEDKIIEGDFLKLDLKDLFPDKYCIIGNYPYNISSQIFFKVLENKDSIPCCSGMIQKEVAERIASKPGKKAYGILSVFLQAFYDIEYLFTVDEHVFDPPPAVKSAVIRMTRNNVRALDCDEEFFRKVVKASFNQRRKTLRNSLKVITGINPVTNADSILNKRPEQLSVAEFVELTNILEKHLRNT